jgi:hypothetical protein
MLLIIPTAVNWDAGDRASPEILDAALACGFGCGFGGPSP